MNTKQPQKKIGKITNISKILSKCDCGAYFLTGEFHTCKTK